MEQEDTNDAPDSCMASESENTEELFGPVVLPKTEDSRWKNRKRSHLGCEFTTPKKRNRETTKDRLLEWHYFYTNVPFGIWIQCTKCNKWRKETEYEESHQVPENWHCSMGKTGEGSCNEPEDVEGIEFSPVDFVPGSIVWAKLDGYPWWPGMIEDDPDNEEYYWLEDNMLYYNVTFLDAKVSHAWVVETNVCSFLNPPRKRHTSSKTKQKYTDLILEAEKRAKLALCMPLKDRLKRFSFVHCFKGKWPIAKDNDHKSSEEYLTEMLIKEVEDIESIHSEDSGTECISDSKSEEISGREIQQHKHRSANALKTNPIKNHKNMKEHHKAEVLIEGKKRKKKNFQKDIRSFMNVIKVYEGGETEQNGKHTDELDIKTETALSKQDNASKGNTSKSRNSILAKGTSNEAKTSISKIAKAGKKISFETLPINKSSKESSVSIKNMEDLSQHKVTVLQKDNGKNEQNEETENKRSKNIFQFPSVLCLNEPVTEMDNNLIKEKIIKNESIQISCNDEKNDAQSKESLRSKIEEREAKPQSSIDGTYDQCKMHKKTKAKILQTNTKDNAAAMLERSLLYDMTIDEVIKASSNEDIPALMENSREQTSSNNVIIDKKAEENLTEEEYVTTMKNNTNGGKQMKNILSLLKKNLNIPQEQDKQTGIDKSSGLNQNSNLKSTKKGKSSKLHEPNIGESGKGIMTIDKSNGRLPKANIKSSKGNKSAKLHESNSGEEGKQMMPIDKKTTLKSAPECDKPVKKIVPKFKPVMKKPKEKLELIKKPTKTKDIIEPEIEMTAEILDTVQPSMKNLCEFAFEPKEKFDESPETNSETMDIIQPKTELNSSDIWDMVQPSSSETMDMIQPSSEQNSHLYEKIVQPSTEQNFSKTMNDAHPSIEQNLSEISFSKPNTEENTSVLDSFEMDDQNLSSNRLARENDGKPDQNTINQDEKDETHKLGHETNFSLQWSPKADHSEGEDSDPYEAD